MDVALKLLCETLVYSVFNVKNTSYSWKAGVSNSNCLGDMMVLSFHKRRALQCSSTARMRNTSENVLFFSMETEKLY